MRPTRLLASILLLVVASIAGCFPEDHVVDHDTPDDEPATVWGLTVIAMEGDQVKLSWKPPSVSKAYIYKIRWRTFDATEDEDVMFEGDGESIDNTYSVLIDRLKPEMYRFTVEVVVPGSYTVLHGVDVYGAPAVRVVDDAARPGERLRLYEPASGRGNGLVIDLEQGSATRVVPAEAEHGTLQFVLLLEGENLGSDNVRFAVAGIVEAHIPAEIYDPTAWIRSAGCADCGLDFMHVTYEEYLREHKPFLEVFHDLPRIYRGQETPSAYVHGAVIGAGNPDGTNYRFARIAFYKAPDGTLLHGQAPNRFIEFQLSLGYRGVPFA